MYLSLVKRVNNMVMMILYSILVLCGEDICNCVWWILLKIEEIKIFGLMVLVICINVLLLNIV